MIELDTPRVVLDVDRLQRNLERWQSHCDESGLANRPHVKTHKSVEIARRQIALGARGITCQKLGEAEVMVDGGIGDILLTYNLLGKLKLERLEALAQRADVAVTVDDARLLEGLARVARRSRELRVLVDCDTGLGRTGVSSPTEAVRLAAAIVRTGGLRFGGFFTYPMLTGALAFLMEVEHRAQRAGLEVGTISVGGTPTMWASAALRPTVTEYRAGTYAFHDRASVAAGAATLDEVAVTVRATVVSRPRLDRAILDAGSKVLTSDPGPGGGFGTVLEAPASVVEWLAEEHAVVELAPGDSLELGQQVAIVPNHVCVVVNLADELIVHREGFEPTAWRVDARGRSR